MVPESDGKSLARDEVCILHLDYAAVIAEMLVASKKVVQHMASYSDSEWELSWSGWFFMNSRSNEPAEGEWPQSDFIKRWAWGSLTLQDFDRLHPEPDQRVNACLASSDHKNNLISITGTNIDYAICLGDAQCIQATPALQNEWTLSFSKILNCFIANTFQSWGKSKPMTKGAKVPISE